MTTPATFPMPPNTGHDDLLRRAERAGIAPTYSGFWGATVEVGDEVLARALASLGSWHDVAAAPASLVIPVGQPHSVEFTQATGWTLHRVESADAPPLASGHGTRAALPPTLAMGIYRLEAGSSVQTVLVAPAQCWLPEGLRHGERWWGITAQMYALRSERSWGVGDFSDLAQCIRLAAAQGAAFVGISPLHALRPGQPDAASPYSPSSRLALNVLHIDVTAVPDFLPCDAVHALCAEPGFRARLQAAQESATVDYHAVAALKDAALACLWQTFRQTAWEGEGTRGAAFDAFRARCAPTLGPHARFEAIQCTLQASDPGIWGWPAWPEALRDPQSPAVQDFLDEHADAVAYRFWLQWLAHDQLAQASATAHALMPIGLYCDLAVGAADGGTDTWAAQALYARGMNAGAPPDPLSPHGQDWGLPPMNPVALAAAHYQPLQRMLAAVMEPAGAVRMDHVMALMRLFWTCEAGGTYVGYPLEAMLAVLAIESHRHHCMVIGEDLGNVAPRMREAMQQGCLLSYRPLLFERSDDGGFRPPAQWHPQALAVVSTHDLPTLRGFWLGEDIELSARLQLYPDQAALEQQVLQRAQDRARLLLALQREGLLPEGVNVQPTSLPDASQAFVDAVYAYLARTPCWLVGLQLEDVTGQVLHVNVPGTTEDRFPNWRRKLSIDVKDLAAEPRWLSVAAMLRAERTGPMALGADDAELPPLESAQVPGSTYRVQFHRGCTFAQVTAALPYLHALGITTLYSSPYLRARPGSTHGYDIIDHSAVNPEVGDAVQHARLCEALRRHGMGQMLDIVPNHMGVLEADNAWWLDVLEHGRASLHAETFDIEWNPTAPEMAGRVLLPVLGDHYGRVLEAAEIQLHFNAEAGEFGLRYWNHRFPVDPGHYPDILAALPAPPARDDGESDSHAVVSSLLDAFRRLPPRNETGDAARRARTRDAAVYKRTLARLAARHEWLAQWIAACVQRLNGQAGEAATFDALDALIAKQAYRLADWRVASDDVNYRRFFDVNTLAALRMERAEVFNATHQKVMHWLQDGWLAALRIDHPDGLSDPQQYFEQLQRRHAQQAAVAGQEPRALYLVVEKILAEHEQLPEGWQVHGDTGYRFASLVNGLFVDSRNEAQVDAAYQAFTREPLDYAEIVYRCKKTIIENSLFSELNWLADALHRIAQANRRATDFTRNRLQVALAEVAAAFPVYRTYLRAGEPPSMMDRQHVDWAVAAARRRLGGSQATVLDYLRSVLLGEGEAADAPVDLRQRFIARWQQFTAPVTAKAVEDTVFYRYLRLVSLNDVGGEPSRFGLSVAAFHSANQGRMRHRPHCLLGTSTHDSKRSEDLRARIDVLSEDPALWQECVQRWAGWAELYLTPGDDGPWPDANTIWLFFQTLAGLWPHEAPDDAGREDLRERMQAYMLKAVREAKRHTSWTCPETAYEEALARYIDAVLRPGQPNPFVDELQRLARRISPFGFRNSLAQVVLKLTAPGVPDIYQGCEQWNFSLVDPDNRRPVDFGRLAADLEGLRAMYQDRWPDEREWAELRVTIADGRIKQLVTWRLLQLRREREALFRDGAYVALAAEGTAADHAVAYARVLDTEAVLVVATRLAYTLCGGDDAAWNPALWSDTQLQPPDALRRFPRWRNWLTGRSIDAAAEEPLALQQIFAGSGDLPFVVLVATP